MKGIVSDIRRFSLHDGPGIRTTVFLKGCNLRCRWCHNPETYETNPQVIFVESKCIGCGVCYEVCPSGALTMTGDGRVFNSEKCIRCHRCVESCYPGALELSGKEMPVQEILAEIMADAAYYAPSGGGVTVSGGEPFMQREVLLEILKGCRQAGIHTCIETNLSLPWRVMLPAIESADLVMVDVKAPDSTVHEQVTGSPNQDLLENIRRLDRLGKRYGIRTPVVPSINDDVASIGAIAAFLSGLQNICCYELLNYNELAELKFGSVGLQYILRGAKPLKEDALAILAKTAQERAPHLDVRYHA